MLHMRCLHYFATAALLASVTSCSGVLPRYSYEDFVPSTKVERQYEARDACLKRAASHNEDQESDPTERGRAIARSCGIEIDRLIATVDSHGDPLVASAIVEDSVRRAARFVLETGTIRGPTTAHRALN